MVDIYAEVIDNYGDMAFAINLIEQVHMRSDEKIRLFSNSQEVYTLFVGNLRKPNLVEYRDFSTLQDTPPSTQIWNLFDKKIPYTYLESFDFQIDIINFSYFLLHEQKNLLSPSIASLHKKEVYRNKNISVRSCIVSLLPGTAWVCIHDISENKEKEDVLQKLGKNTEYASRKKWVSIFAYPETLKKMKEFIKQENEILFIIIGKHELVWDNIISLPFQSLKEYRALLCVCNINIVRGENSLIDAILAGKAFLWDIYKERNGAHEEKIEDFIEFLKVLDFSPEYFETLRRFNAKIWEENIFSGENWNKKNDFEKLKKYTEENCNLYENLHRDFLS